MPQLNDGGTYVGRRVSWKLYMLNMTSSASVLVSVGQSGCHSCMAYSPHHQSYCTLPSGPEHHAASVSQAALPWSSTLQAPYPPVTLSQETVRDGKGREGEGKVRGKVKGGRSEGRGEGRENVRGSVRGSGVQMM